MDFIKCKSCKHFDSFFRSCDLYFKSVYMDEWEFDDQPVPIEDIDENECEYEENCECKN